MSFLSDDLSAYSKEKALLLLKCLCKIDDSSLTPLEIAEMQMDDVAKYLNTNLGVVSAYIYADVFPSVEGNKKYLRVRLHNLANDTTSIVGFLGEIDGDDVTWKECKLGSY